MEKARLLIALKDPEETRAFIGAATAANMEVMTAGDGPSVVEAAIREVPSLILTDARLPVMDGVRVYNILRNNIQTSDIPFVFISDTDSLSMSLRPGFDSLILRPYNIDEVASRLRHTLVQRAQASGGRKELEGDIRQMPLPDILQFLELNKKEGLLKISSGDMSGAVYVKDGYIYNCVLGAADREKALFKLLKWSSGKFEFIPMKVEFARKLTAGTSALIMEGMRQQDELKKLSPGLPAMSDTLRLKHGLPPLKSNVNPVAAEVIRLVRSHPVAEDLVERIQRPDYEVWAAVATLISIGALAVEKTNAREKRRLLTVDEAMRLKERFTRAAQPRIFIAGSSGRVTEDFIGLCGDIQGFTPAVRGFVSSSHDDLRLGAEAMLNVGAGLEFVMFSVPAAAKAGPFISAFFSGLAGVIFLCDNDGLKKAAALSAVKACVRSLKDVPAVHILSGAGNGLVKDYISAMSLAGDADIIAATDGIDRDAPFAAFKRILGALIKADDRGAGKGAFA